jgi:glycerol-3-phosphate acyltransferase PlsY
MTLEQASVPLGAYLLGAIPFGYLLVRWAKGLDVRKEGSGNIGMTNVWRVAGAPWGIATLILDILKGVAAIWLARQVLPGPFWEVLAGLSALVGNVFPVFLRFKGGKGIGVSIGIFFSLLPVESAMGTAAFLASLLATRMVSVGSLAGVSLMAIMALFRMGVAWHSGLALLGCAMVWWTHRENIQRILKGTERRIGRIKGH